MVVTAVNHVKKLKIASLSGMTFRSAGRKIGINTLKDGNASGLIKMELNMVEKDVETTDVPKVYAMQTADGYDSDKLQKGVVSIIKKPVGEQKKITASMSDKRTVKISVKKGAKTGQIIYFLLVYNTNSTSKSKGYEILTVQTQ